MTVENELYLWERLHRNKSSGCQERQGARATAVEMLEKGMIKSLKEVEATLSKWCSSGHYEFGGSVWAGWVPVYRLTYPGVPHRLWPRTHAEVDVFGKEA